MLPSGLFQQRATRRPSTCSRCCRVPQSWPTDAKSASKKLSPATTTGMETSVCARVLQTLRGVKSKDATVYAPHSVEGDIQRDRSTATFRSIVLEGGNAQTVDRSYTWIPLSWPRLYLD
eukprot:scaffold1882_cov34-Phaeocystis_antarctica.AAC.1